MKTFLATAALSLFLSMNSFASDLSSIGKVQCTSANNIIEIDLVKETQTITRYSSSTIIIYNITLDEENNAISFQYDNGVTNYIRFYGAVNEYGYVEAALLNNLNDNYGLNCVAKLKK